MAIASSLDSPLPPGVEKVNYGEKTAKRILRWRTSSRCCSRSRS